MKNKALLKVRTGLKSGADTEYTPPKPSQFGWWWMQSGYIARPGRPLKEFTGWWLGTPPRFYYPVGASLGAGALGATQGAPAIGAGTTAPPAP
jgi:hypothetical protein